MNAQLQHLTLLYQKKKKRLKISDGIGISHFSASSTFIFYPNMGLLGDKILYEPIIRSFRLHNTYATVWGIEWSCDKISMMQFPFPPNATFVLPPFSTKNKIYFERFFKWLDNCNTKYASNLHTYCDHNSNQQFTDKSLAKTIRLKSLWDELAALSKIGRFPKLEVPEQVKSEVESKLKDYSFNIKEKYVTIHIRSLENHGDKNLDFFKYLSVGKEIVKRLGMKVVYLGKSDTFSSEPGNTPKLQSKWIFDWRDKFETVWEAAYLIKNAFAHIGGDSGPTHLAAALGTKIVTVERTLEVPENDYGPFTGNGNVIRLTKKNSSVDNIINSLKTLENNSNTQPGHTTVFDQSEEPCSDSGSNEENGFPVYNNRFIYQEDKEKQDELIKLFTGISNQNIDESSSFLYNRLLEDKIPNSLYVPMRGADLNEFIPFLKNFPVIGFAVFNPFKREILSYIDEMDMFSYITGAADTVLNIKGKWIAYNFNIPAALELLGNVTTLRGKTALIYGDGMETMVLGVELLNKGCDVVTYDENASQCKEADIFINATVFGSENNPLPNIFTNLIPRSVSLIMDFQEDLHNSPLKQISSKRSCKYIGWQEIMKKKVTFQVDTFANQGGLSHVT